MEPHQERVVAERAELSEKVSKLAAFVDGGRMADIPVPERTLLIGQLSVMREYLSILDERLALWVTKGA